MSAAPGSQAGPHWRGTAGRPMPAPRRKFRRAGLLLPAVVLCFLGSIGIRLGSGTGAALAQGVEKLIPATLHDPAQGDGQGDTPALAATESCPVDPALAPILDRLAGREAQLSAGEKALAQRQQTLAVAETRITARLEDLKRAEEKLARTMARTSVAAEDDLSKLTAVYEAMKPKDAVLLFESMAPEFAAGFLGRMRPDAARCGGGDHGGDEPGQGLCGQRDPGRAQCRGAGAARCRPGPGARMTPVLAGWRRER